jgi:hypothetical protein
MRRLPVALAALLTLTLAAALAAAGLSSTPSAQAQQTEEVVFIDNFGVDPDANGYVTLDARDSGFESMLLQCAGAYPQGGTPQIPAQIITRQPQPLLFQLRIFNNKGFAVTNPVRVNCTVDIVVPVPTAPTQARQTLRRVAAQQVTLGR